jgi:hypothetical protein
MALQISPTFTIYRTVTKSDTVDVEMINGHWPSALQCGEAGIVQVVQEDGRVIPFTVAAGQVLPVTFRRVNSGSTAGTLFVALYQQ